MDSFDAVVRLCREQLGGQHDPVLRLCRLMQQHKIIPTSEHLSLELNNPHNKTLVKKHLSEIIDKVIRPDSENFELYKSYTKSEKKQNFTATTGKTNSGSSYPSEQLDDGFIPVVNRRKERTAKISNQPSQEIQKTADALHKRATDKLNQVKNFLKNGF